MNILLLAGFDTKAVVLGGGWAVVSFCLLQIIDRGITGNFYIDSLFDSILVGLNGGLTLWFATHADSAFFPGAAGFLLVFAVLEVLKRIGRFERF